MHAEKKDSNTKETKTIAPSSASKSSNNTKHAQTEPKVAIANNT